MWICNLFLLLFAVFTVCEDSHPADCLVDNNCADIDEASYCHHYACECFAGYIEKDNYCQSKGLWNQTCPDGMDMCPPKEILVKAGNEIVIGCKTEQKSECMWKNPNGTIIHPNLIDDFYEKVNVDVKSCHLKIISPSEQDHGNWTCTPTIRGMDKPLESLPSFVFVASPPPLPSIFYDSEKGLDVIDLPEGPPVSISCHVSASRPSANISWSLTSGESSKSLTKDAEQKAVNLKDAGKDMKRTVSFLTFKPKYQHHRKRLVCDIAHIALDPEKPHRTSAMLNITYRPKILSPKKHDTRYYVVDSRAERVYRFTSNPPPGSDKDIKLVIDGKLAVASGTSAENGAISVSKLTSASNGNPDEYEITVTFKSIKMNETRPTYILSINNRIGKPETFQVLMKVEPSEIPSNHPGRTAGIIIGFILAIIGIIVFYLAWLRSKWCFKPKHHEGLIESTTPINAGPDLFYK